MSSCLTTERRLLDVVRGTATDGERFEVEAHLETCASCREASATFRLLGVVRTVPAKPLGPAARRRVLDYLEALPAESESPAKAAPSRPARLAIAGLAVCAVVIGGGLALRARNGGLPAPALVEGQTIDAAEPGLVAFGGAAVRYDQGTALTFHPTTRTLSVARGRVDVDVTEHLARRFRVTTSRFVVEVLGTRFVVTPSGVRTLRGRVRVLDLDGHDLASVSAGESWSTPTPASSPAPVAPTTAPPPAVAPAPSVVSTPAPARRLDASVNALLARARAALSEGDATRALSLLARARETGPTSDERPRIDLLGADAFLVARRAEDAISAYRSVARRDGGTHEGDTAAFTVGQLLVERGAEAEGAAAFDDYLARYPHGRFVREARDRLRQLRARE